MGDVSAIVSDPWSALLLDSVANPLGLLGPDRRLKASNALFRRCLAPHADQPLRPDQHVELAHASPSVQARWRAACDAALAGDEREVALDDGADDRLTPYRWYVRAAHRGADAAAALIVCGVPRDQDRHASSVRDAGAATGPATGPATGDEVVALRAELDGLVYSISHDLRAPLRSIEGFSRIVVERHAGALDATAQDYLRRVHAAASRLDDMIAALLQLSRLSRAPVRRCPVAVGAIARDLARDLDARTPARVVRWQIDDVTVDADPRLLAAALAQLLDNAWKFTAPRATATIAVGATLQDGAQVVHVRDDGVGFAGGDAERAFAPFQRLHATEDFPGRGLGLAIVRRVVHRHGGRVWAETAIDHGTTVRFTLTPDRARAGGAA
ncbi:MAG: hypothetical protein H6709_04010 [Kofleriaceae bacterium]|nr:hypothetical protein [Kofleriaceae bacterium]MCB9571235.1 hypothetical protein [Kofleriaceae bacterium]